jgi:hypothetical protein
MALADRIQEFLQRLTPLTRNCLLTELERLEMSEGEMPGSAEILAKLRAEFRKDGSSQNRVNTPSRYFFAPLEPLLVDGAPEHANSGLIQRGSLAAIWEWISRDLLPTMARDYVKQVDQLTLSNKPKEAGQVAATFQIKVVKYLENTLGSADGAEQTRKKLASYTASRSAFADLTKMQSVLRERDALAKFNAALPAAIQKFDDARVARRLKTSWQLIRLATKAASSKNAADVAATPYAIVVSMVLDRLEDRRATLRVALRNNRVLVAKEILTDIYDTEYALQVRIDQLDQSEWGVRLATLMTSIATLVEAEVARFPDNVGHVLGSRRLRSHDSIAGRLTYLAYKGRDAVAGSGSLLKKLTGAA